MPAPARTPAKKATASAARRDDDDDDDDSNVSNSLESEQERNRVQSEEQTALLEAGARPVNVDVDTLHAQIQRMQAQLDQMNAQQVDTDDPVGAGVVNLAAHIQARCDADPVLAARAVELRDRIGKVREAEGKLSADDAAELRIYVDEFVEDNPGSELAYVKRLARDLHKAALEKDNKSKKTDKKTDKK